MPGLKRYFLRTERASKGLEFPPVWCRRQKRPEQSAFDDHNREVELGLRLR